MDAKQASGLTLVGGLLLALGSFLAWGSVLGISVSGIDGGDGWYTLIAGAVLALVGFMAWSGKALPVWIGWLALAVGLAVALINFFDIMGTEGVSIGIGMWLMLVGGALGLVGLLMGRKRA